MTDPVLDRIVALQAASGNRAVARLLRAGEGWAVPGLAPTSPTSSSGLPPSLNLPADYAVRRQAEAEAKVREYLDKEKPRVEGQIIIGASVAELVDLMRRNVPEARELAPEQIAQCLRRYFAPLTIAEHRKPGDKEGADKELVAALRNALSKIPTELGIERAHGWAKVTMSGYEVGIRNKDLEAGAEVGWDKSFGGHATVGNVKFAAKVSPPEEAGGPMKWEAQVTLPEADDPVPIASRLSEVVSRAEKATHEAADRARRSGVPSMGELSKLFSPVKEALGALSAIAGVSGPTVGVKIEGEGPKISVQATLTFTF